MGVVWRGLIVATIMIIGLFSAGRDVGAQTCSGTVGVECGSRVCLVGEPDSCQEWGCGGGWDGSRHWNVRRHTDSARWIMSVRRRGCASTRYIASVRTQEEGRKQDKIQWTEPTIPEKRRRIILFAA
jgi:hypothetical protein